MDQPSAPEPDLRDQSEPAESTADADWPDTTPEAAEASSEEAKDDEESSAAPVAIEPEQSPEENNSPDLDGEISTDSTVAGTDAETHDEKPKTAGGEQGDPEQPAQSSPGSP